MRPIRAWWAGLGACLAATAVLVGVALGRAEAAASPGSRAQAFVERLAAALGLPRERVEAALQQALTGMLDDAVRAGRIPADRAEEIRQRIREGRFGVFPHFGRVHGSRAGMAPHGPVLAAAAQLLGMAPDQLRDQLGQGKTLAEVAVEHGKSRDEVRQAILAALRERSEQAVAAGRLTQQDLEAKLKRWETRVDDLLDRPFPAEGHRGQPHPQGSGSGT